jgi:DNA replication regulator DPB11
MFSFTLPKLFVTSSPQSVKTHRLPIFSGVTLSLSGIERIERRTQINKRLSAQGGTYVKNLERPIKVTHLLCSGDNETEKMRYAQKFNERGEAKIWMVWEEWFWDSLEFGGRFDEEKYLVGRPRPDLRSEFVGVSLLFFHLIVTIDT